MHSVNLGLKSGPPVVFGHGWARDHRDFIPTAESLTKFARSHLLDLPGFGESRRPETTWGTLEYANHVAAYLSREIKGPVVWVGHSFGGRIGIQLAARHPDLVAGLILVGSAGVPSEKSAYVRWRATLRQQRFKALRARAKSERERDALERRFGSSDYVASKRLGIRDIFVNVVNEDQSRNLLKIRAPTCFIYGELDNETPPGLGYRMSKLVTNSEFEIVPEFDHNTILSRGYHILSKRIKDMVG